MGTTIAAISSPPGPARRGILRLSGPDARGIVNAALTRPRPALEEGASRGVIEGRFDDGRGTQPVTLFWMPGPHSYTREDVAELHLPGAPPLIARSLERLLELGAHPAQAGEFTRRAFLNGRLDLSRAEGVLSLVEATTEAERRAATLLLDGGLETRVGGLREKLWDLRALCEASLDFDEGDTGHVPEELLLAQLDALRAQMHQALGWEVIRQPPTALPRALLFGEPNAGKSSLFNALVCDGAAIVSDFAGTTRDASVGLAQLGASPGSAVALYDAPGLDGDARGADATAQRLAEIDRRAADLILWVIDVSTLEQARLVRAAAALPERVPLLVVSSKTDLVSGGEDRAATELGHALGQGGLDFSGRPTAQASVSVLGEVGLSELRIQMARLLGFGEGAPEEPRAGVGRELFARHRRALESGQACLEEARQGMLAGIPLDQVAETLRAAGAELDQISGETTVEDVLDRIFASFCIGK